MVEILRSEEFDKSFAGLPKIIQRKGVRKIDIFRANPFHPILRTEKINPPQLNIWSFRIDKVYRILFRFLGMRRVLFLFADHHKNIYRYHELN